jgi:Zn finger protein HypA/HybF involved in hydrogenase expression
MLTIERHEVKCLHCNGKYFKHDGQDTCPHCGMRQPDLETIGKVEIEINLNQLTGEVTAF